MLKNPKDRPTINAILRRPLITARIERFLSSTMIQSEFSHTVLHKQPFRQSAAAATAPAPPAPIGGAAALQGGGRPPVAPVHPSIPTPPAPLVSPARPSVPTPPSAMPAPLQGFGGGSPQRGPSLPAVAPGAAAAAQRGVAVLPGGTATSCACAVARAARTRGMFAAAVRVPKSVC